MRSIGGAVMTQDTTTTPNRALDAASARAEGEASPAAPYDPDNDVTASEPFDVMDFIRVIHRERDAS